MELRLVLFDAYGKEVEYYEIKQLASDLADHLKTHVLLNPFSNKKKHIAETMEQLVEGFQKYGKDLYTVNLLKELKKG